MSQSTTPPSISHTKAIRNRLIGLLLRVFAVIILIAILLSSGLIFIVQKGPRSDKAQFPPAQLANLRAYYLANNSWDGVDILWEAIPANDSDVDQWSRLLLLDQDQRVIGGGSTEIPLGQPYLNIEDRITFPVQIDGQSVGKLILTTDFFSPPLIVVLGVAPLVVIGLITAAITLYVGLALMRRAVSPLADVIAAAQAVTAGDLAARATVSGTSDFRVLSDAFNQMVDTLQQNEQQRRNLLADIAHELRTPLTILRGKLEGILDGIYTPDEAHIAPALMQTRLLEKLVDDLRVLTLAESRQLSIERRPVHLGELAEQVASLFEADALARDVAVTVDVAAGLRSISADPQRISQVIGNLLNNALRHTPDNGQIEIVVSQTADAVSFSIADSGAGVAEADLPYLFDRFWRAEKSRNRSSGGAGLGLAIAKQLLEAQDGHISAHNQPDSGLCVTFGFDVG